MQEGELAKMQTTVLGDWQLPEQWTNAEMDWQIEQFAKCMTEI